MRKCLETSWTAEIDRLHNVTHAAALSGTVRTLPSCRGVGSLPIFSGQACSSSSAMMIWELTWAFAMRNTKNGKRSIWKGAKRSYRNDLTLGKSRLVGLSDSNPFPRMESKDVHLSRSRDSKLQLMKERTKPPKNSGSPS